MINILITCTCIVYKEKINSYADWRNRNHLLLSKTKEMVIDFRRQENNPETIVR